MDSGNNNTKPYIDYKDNNIRIFSGDADEFVWHRDQEDRYIIPLHDTDWKFQIDNKLPINMVKNEPIFIGKMIYHRLIKGVTDVLELKVLDI
jgi:hypothetical protein